MRGEYRNRCLNFSYFIYYHNFRYKVWSVTPSSDEQGKLLLKWEDNVSIDFWEQISRIGLSSRIMAAPEVQFEFEYFLKDNEIEHQLIIENVERYNAVQWKKCFNFNFFSIPTEYLNANAKKITNTTLSTKASQGLEILTITGHSVKLIDISHN